MCLLLRLQAQCVRQPWPADQALHGPQRRTRLFRSAVAKAFSEGEGRRLHTGSLGVVRQDGMLKGRLFYVCLPGEEGVVQGGGRKG